MSEDKEKKFNSKIIGNVIAIILLFLILILLILGVIYIIDPLKLPFTLNRPFIEKTLDSPQLLFSKQAGNYGVLKYSTKLFIIDDYNHISKEQLTSSTNLLNQTVFSTNNLDSDFNISEDNKYLYFKNINEEIIRIGVLCDYNKSSLLETAKNYEFEIKNNTINDIENFNFEDEEYISCVVFPEKADRYVLVKNLSK